MKPFKDLLVFLPLLTNALDRELTESNRRQIDALIEEIIDIPDTVKIEDTALANKIFSGLTVSDEKYEDIKKRTFDLI